MSPQPEREQLAGCWACCNIGTINDNLLHISLEMRKRLVGDLYINMNPYIEVGAGKSAKRQNDCVESWLSSMQIAGGNPEWPETLFFDEKQPRRNSLFCVNDQTLSKRISESARKSSRWLFRTQKSEVLIDSTDCSQKRSVLTIRQDAA